MPGRPKAYEQVIRTLQNCLDFTLLALYQPNPACSTLTVSSPVLEAVVHTSLAMQWLQSRLTLEGEANSLTVPMNSHELSPHVASVTQVALDMVATQAEAARVDVYLISLLDHWGTPQDLANKANPAFYSDTERSEMIWSPSKHYPFAVITVLIHVFSWLIHIAAQDSRMVVLASLHKSLLKSSVKVYFDATVSTVEGTTWPSWLGPFVDMQYMLEEFGILIEQAPLTPEEAAGHRMIQPLATATAPTCLTLTLTRPDATDLIARETVVAPAWPIISNNLPLNTVVPLLANTRVAIAMDDPLLTQVLEYATDWGCVAVNVDDKPDIVMVRRNVAVARPYVLRGIPCICFGTVLHLANEQILPEKVVPVTEPISRTRFVHGLYCAIKLLHDKNVSAEVLSPPEIPLLAVSPSPFSPPAAPEDLKRRSSSVDPTVLSQRFQSMMELNRSSSTLPDMAREMLVPPTTSTTPCTSAFASTSDSPSASSVLSLSSSLTLPDETESLSTTTSASAISPMPSTPLPSTSSMATPMLDTAPGAETPVPASQSMTSTSASTLATAMNPAATIVASTASPELPTPVATTILPRVAAAKANLAVPGAALPSPVLLTTVSSLGSDASTISPTVKAQMVNEALTSQETKTDYFTRAVTHLATQANMAGGRVVHGADGRPTGLYFQPRDTPSSAGQPTPPAERRDSLTNPDTSSYPSSVKLREAQLSVLPDADSHTPASQLPISTLSFSQREHVTRPNAPTSIPLPPPPPSADLAHQGRPTPFKQLPTRAQQGPTATQPQAGVMIGGRDGTSTRPKEAQKVPLSPRASARLQKRKLALREEYLPPVKVLIVEDNVINQRILATFLRRKHIAYDVASDGREAIEKWREGDFHLILMDIQLPVLDGIAATKEIRRLEKLAQSSTKTDEKPLPASATRHSVIIVGLTASVLNSDRVEALAAGCNDYLNKPVSLPWLQRKILEWGSMQYLLHAGVATAKSSPAPSPMPSALSSTSPGNPRRLLASFTEHVDARTSRVARHLHLPPSSRNRPLDAPPPL
ncbi:Two-component response regulator Ss [Malassezia pachydermatis]|uniref:Two-component response regulator n=1 Tax=Malassezia pachydermatis TaxID=77020 RepID=A0A0M8MRX3_9BASI|nr:two-component response regulator [Malassezia pachydermatis]KOS12560.1 two-component response regulator [Malassezia pachydermatis]